MASGASLSPAMFCDECGKAEDPLNPLKRCAKCQIAEYCNRECQKAHWKVHKNVCTYYAAKVDKPAGENCYSRRQQPARSDAKPFTAIYHNNFLHDRPEDETRKILIDVLRMCVADGFTEQDHPMTKTAATGKDSSETAFRQFVSKASTVPGFLPAWWSSVEVEECVRMSDTCKSFSLKHNIPEAAVAKQWADESMPMKLRFLGMKVYGPREVMPGGVSNEEMMAMMVAME